MASPSMMHMSPLIRSDQLWHGEDCTMNKPIDSFQGRPIVSQRAGLSVTRVAAPLGAEIAGVDLRKPISEEVRDAIETALVENELIIFRNQDISSENLIDFGS